MKEEMIETQTAKILSKQEAIDDYSARIQER